MRVLHLPERQLAHRERALLERLSVGLADEGVRVLQGVPGVGLDADDLRTERLGLFATPVPFADVGLPMTEGLRARVLLESASRAMSGVRTTAGGVDVVHTWGPRTWEVGWQVAQQSKAALVMEVFSLSCVEAAARWMRRARRGVRVWWNVADRSLARVLEERLGSAEGISVNPWGVHVPDRPHSELSMERAATIVLWCGGGSDRGLRAMFEALVERGQSERGLLILAQDYAAERLKLWPLARSLDLTNRLSIVPELTERWDLTLEADALVIPIAGGEQHGFVLDAMAAGMPVIAKADPAASHLIEQETSVLVRGSAAEQWRAALDDVLDHPERAAAIGAGARKYVRENRLASAWVSGIVRLYDRAARGGAAMSGSVGAEQR